LTNDDICTGVMPLIKMAHCKIKISTILLSNSLVCRPYLIELRNAKWITPKSPFQQKLAINKSIKNEATPSPQIQIQKLMEFIDKLRIREHPS